MTSRIRTTLAVCVGMALATGTALAAVDAGQAAKLGQELTAIGAVAAGNADGDGDDE